LRRINVVVVSVLLMSLMLALAGSAALADRPPTKGQNCDAVTCEDKQTGKPVNPSGFGGAASQVATDKTEATGTKGKGGLGEHSSSQKEPRDGVGNVARNDEFSDPAEGGDDHPGSHGCLVGAQMGTGCTPPGKE
jgi:hypothetical protein